MFATIIECLSNSIIILSLLDGTKELQYGQYSNTQCDVRQYGSAKLQVTHVA